MIELLAYIIVEVAAFMFSGVFSERSRARVNEDVPGWVLRVALSILGMLAVIAIFVGFIFVMVRIIAHR